jgi:hypothetical protein
MIYREIKTEKDGEALQDDLENLELWEKDWSMSFNPDKCTTLRVTRSRK